MHIRRGLLGWGVFLILAGAIPLAVRAGYLSQNQVDRLWNLWPLILIGLGVGLILSRTRFEFVGGLIVAATFGIMAGGLLSGGMGSFSTGACGPGSGTVGFPVQEGVLEADTATVDIQLDCGNLTVDTGSGTAWYVEGQDGTGAGPEVRSDTDALSVRSRDGDRGPLGIFGERETWRITVPEEPLLDMDVQANAGEATIDLDGTALATFGLELNAGSATVDLGSVDEIEAVQIGLNAGSIGLTLPNLSLTGSIEVNAGSVSLCAPPGAALKFRTGESIVASYDFAGHGLVQDGSTWATPGFDTATVRIELRTEANAGSFVLNPEDGCG